jgi:hypothetical protein
MNTLKIIAICLFLLIGVTQAQQAEPEFDPSVDFSKYKTYSWVEDESIPLAVPYEPDTPRETTDALIRAAIEEELDQKGFVKNESGQTDLQITYFGVGRSRIELPEDLPYDQSGYQGEARVVTEGTLTVDVVDARKKRLIWRGRAVEMFRELEEAEDKIRSAVSQVFEDFPPK